MKYNILIKIKFKYKKKINQKKITHNNKNPIN